MQLFEQLFHWGAHLPATGLYLFVFGWLFLESTGFPISDEPLLLLAGYLTTTGKINLALVILIALVGKVAASYCAFLLGHVINLERLARPEQRPTHKLGLLLWYLRPTMGAVIATEERVRKSGAWGVFLGRLVPVVRSFISYPAGAARMRHDVFLGATAAGSFLWIAGWTITGAVVGRSYREVAGKLGSVSLVLLALAAIGIIALLVWNHRRAEAEAVRLQAQRIALAAQKAREHLPHRAHPHSSSAAARKSAPATLKSKANGKTMPAASKPALETKKSIKP